MPSHHMGHMTWQQVAEAAARDVPVLLPCGTLEAQGLYSPMGHDYIVAERLALAVSERTECLVAPTLPFGYSPFLMSFSGTISLRPETLRMLFKDMVESLLRHGFKHLIFINNHGASEPMLWHVAEETRVEHGVVLASIFPTRLAEDLSKDLFETQKGVFAHGGEPTISVMMYLCPEDMQLENLQRISFTSPWNNFEIPGPNAIRMNGANVTVYMNFAELIPTGGTGDPAQGSADKGKIMFDRMVDFIAAFVPEFRKVPM
ncbi:MAG TPA: creatininase family protein [Anaerolineae bacterium]|nr:creatininase family protein [Anaerolineae bacterium]